MNDQVIKETLRQIYDAAINHAIQIVQDYRDQILPEAYDEIMRRLEQQK